MIIIEPGQLYITKRLIRAYMAFPVRTFFDETYDIQPKSIVMALGYPYISKTHGWSNGVGFVRVLSKDKIGIISFWNTAHGKCLLRLPGSPIGASSELQEAVMQTKK